MKNRQALLEKTFFKYLKNPNIKVISFDIFDTLFFRKVNFPSDVFYILAKQEYVKRLFPKNSFAYYRLEAHKSALKRHKKEEVTLSEIYNEFPYLKDEEKKKLINLEIEEEQKQLIVNEYLQEWIKLAIKYKKDVIVISDMYLSTKELDFVSLSKLQEEAKIRKIYVSSELKKSKYTGTLFKEVIDDLKLKPEEIVHIGDNQRNDVIMPNKLGIFTIHYKKFEDKNEKNYINGPYPKKLNMSRSLSINLNTYSNEREKFFYEFGGNIFGPLFWTFSSYILKSSKELKTNQINFIMREGVIFKKYFNKFLETLNLENEYILNTISASRKSIYLTMLDENNIQINKNDFLSFREVSLENFFTVLGIKVLSSELKDYKEHSISMLSCKENFYEKINNDIEIQKDKIKNKIVKTKKYLNQYLSQSNLQKGSLLIDFGSSGSVNQAINKFTLDKELNHLLLYSSSHAYKRLDLRLDSFLSLNEVNKKESILLRRYAEVFEVLLNGIENTTLEYIKNVKIEPLKSDINFSDEFKSTISSFEKGIDTFFEIAHKYKFKKASPSFLIKMLSRVLELPTNDETKYLGNLPIELSYDGNIQTTIINDENINIVNKYGVDTILNEFYLDSESYIKELPWLHGSISKIDNEYFKNKIFNDELDSLETTQKKILFKLDKENIKELSIYGVGELFKLLHDKLIQKGIKINYLIDSFISEKEQKFINDYLIINLEEAIKKGESNILITSISYKDEMIRKVNHYPNIVCIS
jgi:predicted HAD superfamily hydrolase